jgi:hypothetical protein
LHFKDDNCNAVTGNTDERFPIMMKKLKPFDYEINSITSSIFYTSSEEYNVQED